jgi:hypothetical protein
MTAVYRTGTRLYRQASGRFARRRWRICHYWRQWIPSRYRGPPRLGRGGLSRGAGAKAAEEEVKDRYEAGGLPGFVSFSWPLKRCRQVGLPCKLRANNATQAVMVATGQQLLPVWPGLTSRKLRWTAARGRKEDVRSRRTARLRELQLG